MRIKDGYNDKETIIRVVAQPQNRCAELWIEQTGTEEKETLSYITVEELLDLRDEILKALEVICLGGGN